MATAKNYLLGYGQRLTVGIHAPGGGGPKKHPYTLSEAQQRIGKRLASVAEQLEKLPAAACPSGMSVITLTLHPSYIAKSYYPNDLIDTLGLRHVGSQGRVITPEKWGSSRHKETAATTDLFMAVRRDSIAKLRQKIANWTTNNFGAAQLREVEDIYVRSAKSRILHIETASEVVPLEVVLHASALPDTEFVLEGFVEYTRKLGIKFNLQKRIHVGGLCFIPMNAPRELITSLCEFSFLRVVREMPRLRDLESVIRHAPGLFESPLLPNSSVLDPNLRVAIFDGGLPEKSSLLPWVNTREPRGIGKSVQSHLDHGQKVTSAFLFGSTSPTHTTLPQPVAKVDHWRVLDENTAKNDSEMNLFEVISRIQNVLSQISYDFINLSIGPDLSIDDNEVHVWTAVLDDHFSRGDLLATIAAGNNGANDSALGYNRVQPPADCVNAMSVGACDAPIGKFRRAPYSAIGPGRSPGLVKPDAVCFGGVKSSPFWTIDGDGRFAGVCGTSFSAPLAMRLAAGIRAQLGAVVNPLAIKALLVHRTERGGNHQHEVGWGRTYHNLDTLLTSDDDSAHIIYQGELEPGKYLRAYIPIPAGQLAGRIDITATFCFMTPVDAEDSINYTRSGLDITFRPHEKMRSQGPKQRYPDAASFFKSSAFANLSESELRADAHKWETTLHRKRSIDGVGLNNPVFDIHYNARKAGAQTHIAPKIPYALAITVHGKEMPDLYDRIVRRYRQQLEILKPVQITLRG